MTGIYKILSPSGRVYIGQSVDIKRRFREYKSRYSTYQTKLTRSFDKYGVNLHSFEVITECDIEELNNLERYYQDLYNAMREGLNCKLTTSKDRSGKLSDETKKKIGEKSKGRKFSDEYKENMSKIMTGRTFSDEWKQKLSEKAKIRKVLPETREKARLIKIGTKLSDEIKLKMSQSSPFKKGVICIKSGKKWNSIIDCANENNFIPVTLGRKLSGKRKNNTSFMLYE